MKLKQILAVVIILSAFAVAGTLSFNDQAVAEISRCEMVLTYEQTKHRGLDAYGWPAESEQELKRCEALINNQK